jgi:hypothetical protein
MDSFLKNKNKYDHLIVYCYHGILSRDIDLDTREEGYYRISKLKLSFYFKQYKDKFKYFLCEFL